jgi:hypothetical protein
MVRASYSGAVRVFNKTDNREVRRRNVAGTKKVDLPPGDGLAGVRATRGFKHWFSTKEAGLTVESTMEVRLTCGQNEKAIMAAGEVAGQMAEQLALEGMEEMDMHIDQFVKEAR